MPSFDSLTPFATLLNQGSLISWLRTYRLRVFIRVDAIFIRNAIVLAISKLRAKRRWDLLNWRNTLSFSRSAKTLDLIGSSFSLSFQLCSSNWGVTPIAH